MGIELLKTQIIQAFGDKWELNDMAHRETHFENVFKTGMLINERLKLWYLPKQILFAAYFHDLFAWSRINHHELSYKWMMTTDHPLILSNLEAEEVELVAKACLQHRASFKGEFFGKFCELINSADREMPGDVSKMLERAIQFREKNFPKMSEDQRYEDAVLHLKDKFGVGGYARYPKMYTDCFGEELELQRQRVMAL